MKNPVAKDHAAPADNELDAAALDEVVGGFSTGLYGSVGYTGLTGSGNVTVAVGVQSSFPFVTGGIYTTQGNGYSTGISAGGSVGVFGATGNADSYFTGPGNAGALGIDALGKVGVEGGINSSGASLGANIGIGIGVEGVQASGMHTEGTSVFSSEGANFNMNGSGPGVPTSSPQEYGGYFNASQSPPLDHYEPNSPELNAAIGAYNAGHTDDPGHTDAPIHSDDLGNSYNAGPTGDAGHTDAPIHSDDLGNSYDAGHGDDAGHANDNSNFGNDFGDSNFGGGDFGGSDFG
ncbi:MAG TPA: hypothetical protein VF469_02560 [Kofleriaceae bacterium]